MSEDEKPKPRRLPSIQQVGGGAVGCLVLGVILLFFMAILWVGSAYIQSH